MWRTRFMTASDCQGDAFPPCRECGGQVSGGVGGAMMAKIVVETEARRLRLLPRQTAIGASTGSR